MTKLRDVCKWYKGMPHQDVALDWLEKNLPQGVMHVFLEKWRDAPPEPEVPTGINEAGLDLIKEFEGCRLEAYLCPAGVWTIGWGRTKGVYPHQTCTQQEADNWLKEDLWTYEDCVSRLINVTLTDNEYAALVSFAYNCGCGALQDSTMRRRLNAGEDKETVFRQELPKWVRGGGQVLPGLVRRRNAEIALACS
jgi:lysozyme